MFCKRRSNGRLTSGRGTGRFRLLHFPLFLCFVGFLTRLNGHRYQGLSLGEQTFPLFDNDTHLFPSLPEVSAGLLGRVQRGFPDLLSRSSNPAAVSAKERSPHPQPLRAERRLPSDNGPGLPSKVYALCQQLHSLLLRHVDSSFLILSQGRGC